MMKKIFLFFILICAVINNGCDMISENERTIEMEDVIPVKKVLLLDFTDQKCINCLRATEEIQKLLGIYKDTLVVVSIHASPRPLPLVTATGNEYSAYFRVYGNPTGIVDGVLSSTRPQLWGGYVIERSAIETSLGIDLSVSHKKETRELKVITKINGIVKHDEIRLLLWIVENKIIDTQLMLDGKDKPDYEHNHVFRAAINGTWGNDAFSINENEEKTVENSYTLNENWKTENISIVGFIYDAKSNEVLGVDEVKIVNTESN
jgi:hypothetical protein